MSRSVTHADSPFDDTQEARIHTIARGLVRDTLEELASRGGLPAPAADVLDAMGARDHGAEQIARFPHREDVSG